jgi:AraC-like DNA-binding protein
MSNFYKRFEPPGAIVTRPVVDSFAVPEFAFFAPRPALADVVESIWDVDVPEGARARAMTFKILPGVSPTLCAHYRTAPVSNQPVNPGGWHQRVTGVQTRAITIQPAGPLGAVIVHFRPEAAYRVFGGCMEEFTDANVRLSDLLSPSAAAMLDESLKEAAGARDRVDRIQAFLLQHLHTHRSDPLVHHAVLRLCGKPGAPVQQLAAGLHISHKQLSRRFRRVTGTGLKQFARVARFSQAFQARRRGHHWIEIAYGAGFSDQAHLSQEFKFMTGHSPTSLSLAAAAGHRRLNTSLAASSFFNTLVL